MEVESLNHCVVAPALETAVNVMLPGPTLEEPNAVTNEGTVTGVKVLELIWLLQYTIPGPFTQAFTESILVRMPFLA